MVYILDTCSIIAGRDEIYCARNFPHLWKNIEEEIKNGEIFISDAVFDELKKIAQYTRSDDASSGTSQTNSGRDACSWAENFKVTIQKNHKIDKQQLQIDIASLVSGYPSLARTGAADYEVIAVAKQLKGIVVTQERANRSTQTAKNKIPTVCGKEGVSCVNLSGMIQRYDWRFGSFT